MADDNAARKLGDAPVEGNGDRVLRVRTLPDPNPRYAAFLERTKDWDDAFDIPASKRVKD